MKKKQLVVKRRQFLRGAGGVVLGVPFLPSLVPGRAWAQSVTFDPGPRFFAMCTNHGGIDEPSMYPTVTMGMQSEPIYPGHTGHHGALPLSVNGSRASVSSVLSGPSSLLSRQLVSKMNVLRGLDIPFYIAHHTGGHLGNYARNDGNGDSGASINSQFMPTIDQVMAYSQSFYRDLNGVGARSLHAGFRQLSWGFSNPSAGSGTIEEIRVEDGAHALFDSAFPNGAPDPDRSGTPAPAPTRPPIVDQVLEHYRSLRQSNRRLSAHDRQRLDDHMDRLAEVQRRMATTRPTEPSAACEDISPPSGAGDAALVDAITSAFACGASRIAVVGVSERSYVRYSGDWHQDVAHQHTLDGPQALLVEANQAAFENVFLRLAAALDAVEEAPGTSVLDNTLMTWSQESGEVTHDSRSAPVVTFGSAGGAIHTGQVFDYRNHNSEGVLGLLYSQWLASILQIMGVPRSEWQNIPNNAPTGYAVDQIDPEYARAYVRGVVENASDILPWLKA
ncbi:MAG: DUF1552 domain-containing protein [Myxococcales bacterium]|nr:DUF1552 domain-containing protein [Myxococcales bacterium]